MKRSVYFALVVFAVLFCFAECRKERQALTITLHDKPLATIQSYIHGKWRLQYAKGGFCGTCVWPGRQNQYILINEQTIVFGNDSAGIIHDTTIKWIRARDVFSDSTFLLTYYYPRGAGPFPISYIVDGIYNDTLKLVENANDPLYYYYTKY